MAKPRKLGYRKYLETILGRKLGKDEVVHHRNGDARDNRRSNLMVVTKEEHKIIHYKGMDAYYRFKKMKGGE